MRTGLGFRRTLAAITSAGSILALLVLASGADAHPLGNFTINHFARLTVDRNKVQLKFIVDMAEISTIQQLQSAGTADASKPTQAELDSYLARATDEYRRGLVIMLDGRRLELNSQSMSISLLPGAGDLNTLRIECEFRVALPKIEAGQTCQVRFEDANHTSRIGWHEIVVQPDAGITVFDSSAYGSAVTDELKAYPQDALTAPLDERIAQFSFSAGGVAPAGSRPLLTRDGRQCVRTRDRLAELIAVPEVTPGIVLLGLLLAAGLGGLHALSPGHGKTVVGAYLVGSRGTARHAAFLGLTVTLTHTAGVFALGLVTLVASQYILPERLFPFLSLASGAIVVGIGLSLFLKRFRAALPAKLWGHRHAEHEPLHRHEHEREHGHGHPHHHEHHDGHAAYEAEAEKAHAHYHSAIAHRHGAEFHTHEHGHHGSHESDHVQDLCGEDEEGAGAHGDAGAGHMHSHGGPSHSHLPPGTDGSRITWRSLLALGISGGLLPCPSALVVLLASISLHRVGYGLLLVIAFSIGLASVLTAIGLLFVYAGRLMKSRAGGRAAFAARFVPVLSAFVITCAGAAICWQALVQAGLNPFSNWHI